MLKSTHEEVRKENGFLRSALNEANKELLKHKKLVAGIQSGQIDVVKILDKIAARK